MDNVDLAFASNIATTTAPRWQRKAMESIQTPRKDRKSSSSTPQADRFIPNRSMMNFEACHFNLTNAEEEEEVVCSPSKLDYQRSMKSSLFQDQSSKILAFKQQAPKPKEGYQNELKVLYTANKTAAKTANVTRHIPQTPDRILDAPELRADYYLNLLDWSSTNVIAVALGETVYLWNASNGSISELCQTEGADNYVSSVSWLNDGAYLAVGTADATVQIWDVVQQKRVRTMAGQHDSRVGAMDWNEHILTSGSKSGLIVNSDVRVQDHCVGTLRGHTQEVCGLKWSPDGKLLASGGNDNVLNIWTAEGNKQHSLTQHTAAVKALAWCPWQSNLLASGGGSADRHIRFWNTTTGACVNSIDTKSQVCSLLWNKEHHEIISGHGFSQNQLTIWKYPTLSKVTELTGHTQRVLSMAMSPDCSTVVSAAADETLRFWKCFATDTKKKSIKRPETSNSRLSAQIR